MSEAWQPGSPEEEFNPELELARDVIDKVERIVWADSRSTTFTLASLSAETEIHEDPETAEVILEAGMYHIQTLYGFLKKRTDEAGKTLDLHDANFGLLYSRDVITGTTKAYTCTDIITEAGTSYLATLIIQDPEIRKSYIVMVDHGGRTISGSNTIMTADSYPSGIIGPAGADVMDLIGMVQGGRLDDEDLETALEVLREYAQTVAESDDDIEKFIDILRRRHGSSRMMREITGGAVETRLDNSELLELYQLLDEEI